jgi:hypothetical protein
MAPLALPLPALDPLAPVDPLAVDPLVPVVPLPPEEPALDPLDAPFPLPPWPNPCTSAPAPEQPESATTTNRPRHNIPVMGDLPGVAFRKIEVRQYRATPYEA